MEYDKETEKLFVGRYLDFWICFNPGKPMATGLRDAGRRYYQLLSEEGVKFQDFDRICKVLEKDSCSLGYEFNLVAYVLDFIRSEKADRTGLVTDFFNRPVELPTDGKELFSDNPRVIEAVETLRRHNINAFSVVIKKLNTLREEGKFLDASYKCYACHDTGMIGLSMYFDHETGRKRGKICEPSDFGCIQVTKRCICPLGEQLSSAIPQASQRECSESAKIHTGKIIDIRPGQRQFAGVGVGANEPPF